MQTRLCVSPMLVSAGSHFEIVRKRKASTDCHAFDRCGLSLTPLLAVPLATERKQTADSKEGRQRRVGSPQLDNSFFRSSMKNWKLKPQRDRPRASISGFDKDRTYPL